MIKTPLTNFVDSLISTHQLQKLCVQAEVTDPNQMYQVYQAMYRFHLDQWNTYVIKMVNFCAAKIMQLEEMMSNMTQQNLKLLRFADSVVDFCNVARLEVQHDDLYNFLLSHEIWLMEVKFELTMFRTISVKKVRQDLLSAILSAKDKLQKKLLLCLEQKKKLGIMMLDIQYCKREIDMTIHIFRSSEFSKEQIKMLKKIKKNKVYRSAFKRCTKLMNLK